MCGNYESLNLSHDLGTVTKMFHTVFREGVSIYCTILKFQKNFSHVVGCEVM